MNAHKNGLRDTEKKIFYVVMKAYEWNCLKVGIGSLRAPPGGPARFIPVFDTEAEAIAWAGEKERVSPVVVTQETTNPPRMKRGATKGKA